MPKIADIEETPNPNAVKFILREAVSNGVAKQYGSADLAENDPLAQSLFDVGFALLKLLTRRQQWQRLLRRSVVRLRQLRVTTRGC
jgi:hypothetical protein